MIANTRKPEGERKLCHNCHTNLLAAVEKKYEFDGPKGRAILPAVAAPSVPTRSPI
jgi:hypothetical protein